MTTYATILSFTGITKRTTSWMRSHPAKHGQPRRVGLWLVVSLYLSLAWAFVLCWYVLIAATFYIVIPWRVIRRGQRRNRDLQEQQLRAIREVAQR